MGNRIMSDATFGTNHQLAIIGFFVKDAALHYMQLKPQLSSSDFTKAKSFGDAYLQTLLDNFDFEDKSLLWVNFHEFDKELEAFGLKDIERSSYETNLEVTESAVSYFIELLVQNREVLCKSNNNLLDGVLGELHRITRVYGFRLIDTIIFSALIALHRYYSYLRMEYLTQENENNRQEVQVKIYPYIDKIKEFSLSTEINYDDVNGFLWNLIKEWRLYYILYSELPRPPQKPIELPQESKNKLSEVIGKALEKEIKP